MATFQEIKRINKKTKKEKIITKVIVRKKGYKKVTKNFLRKTDAHNWATEVEAAMNNGTYVEKITAAENKKIKIEYISELIDYFKNYTAPTNYDDAYRYNCMYEWWTNMIGNIKVKDLKASNLAECKRLLNSEIIHTGKPRQANTINKYLMCISAVLTHAVKELEIIPYNPMSKVGSMKKPNGRCRFLSEKELEIYRNACKAHSDIVFLFVEIALGTGGRYSEILHLKIENIDFQNKRVHFIDTKNGTNRGVRLETSIMNLLKDYCQNHNIKTGYIFKGKQEGKLAYIRGRIYKIIKQTRLENFRIHDMRHTFASYAAMNGASLLDIAVILGQKTLTVARRYAHLTTMHTDSIVEKVAAKILPELKEEKADESYSNI